MNLRIGRKTGYMIPSPADRRDPGSKQEGAMFVRVTTMMFRNEAFEDGVRLFEESVLPSARAQKGFRGAYLLGDRKAGRALALTFWEDEAAAVANEENRYYQEQLVKFLPNFTAPPVREGYDVIVESR
jgi:heme-degrading monooxygenase HmoA